MPYCMTQPSQQPHLISIHDSRPFPLTPCIPWHPPLPVIFLAFFPFLKGHATLAQAIGRHISLPSSFLMSRSSSTSPSKSSHPPPKFSTQTTPPSSCLRRLCSQLGKTGLSGPTSVAGPSVEQVQSSYQQGVSAVQRDGSS